MKKNNTHNFASAKFEFTIIGILEFFGLLYLLSYFFQQNVIILSKGF